MIFLWFSFYELLRAKYLLKNEKYTKFDGFGKPFLGQNWRNHKVRKVSNAFISAGSKQKNAKISRFCIFLTKNRSFWCLRLYHSVHFFEKHEISVFVVQLSVRTNGKLKSATIKNREFRLLGGIRRGHWFEPISQIWE